MEKCKHCGNFNGGHVVVYFTKNDLESINDLFSDRHREIRRLYNKDENDEGEVKGYLQAGNIDIIFCPLKEEKEE